MRSVCAKKAPFQTKKHPLKRPHCQLISCSFVTGYKIHIKSDHNKEGNRQAGAKPHCTEDRLTKLLLPTLLPNRWLTLYLNKKVKLGKLQKRTEKISLVTHL